MARTRCSAEETFLMARRRYQRTRNAGLERERGSAWTGRRPLFESFRHPLRGSPSAGTTARPGLERVLTLAGIRNLSRRACSNSKDMGSTCEGRKGEACCRHGSCAALPWLDRRWPSVQQVPVRAFGNVTHQNWRSLVGALASEACKTCIAPFVLGRLCCGACSCRVARLGLLRWARRTADRETPP